MLSAMGETFPAGADGSLPAPPAPPTAVDVLQGAVDQVVATLKRQVEWYRHHPIEAVACGVVGFLVAWATNTAIMAVKYDGYRVARGSAAAGEGNVFWGGAFWLLLPGLVAACAVYTIRVGPMQALRQVAGLPGMLKGAARIDRNAVPHVLGGFAVGGVISVLTVPLVSGVAAGWLVFAMVTRLRSVAVSFVSALWRLVSERLGGKPDHVGPMSSLLALAGTTGAMVVAWLVPSRALVLFAALLAGVIAVLMSRAAAPRPTAATTALVLVVLGVAGVIAVVVFAGPAFADDGGWPECGRPNAFKWVTSCAGSGRVLLDSLLFGGIPGFIGGLFGGGAGGAGGEEPGPFIPGTGCKAPPGPLPMSDERADLLKWRALHPDAPVQEYWEYKERVEEFKQWQQEPDDPFYARWWRDMNRYNEEVGNALWEDYDSGNMGDRLRRMPKHVLPAMINATGTMLKGLAAQGKDMMEAGGPMMYPLKLAGDSFKMMVDQASVLTELQAMQQRGASPEEIRAYSRQQVERMAPGLLPTMEKYVDASLKNDNETVAKMTTELFAHVEVMAIAGKGQSFLTEKAMLANAARTEAAAIANIEAKIMAAPEPSVPPRAPPRAPAPDPVAPPRTREQLMALAEQHGEVRLTPAEARSLGLESQIADDLWDHSLRWGGSTEFKLGTAETVAMRESGMHQPKPGCYVGPDGVEAPSLLVKSINEVDGAISPQLAGKKGIVSFVDAAEPPVGTPEHARWQWRQQERVDLKESMDVLGTKGGIKIDENGKPVPYHVDEMPDGTLVDRATGKTFVPDNDTYTGNPGTLTPEQYQSSLYKLGRGTIQHPGDTPNWHIPLDDPDFAYKVKVKNKVIADVEKEGRLRIDADGPKLCKMPAKPGGPSGSQAPPGYDAPAPGSGGAPPGYDAPAPGSGGAPPGYDTSGGGR